MIRQPFAKPSQTPHENGADHVLHTARLRVRRLSIHPQFIHHEIPQQCVPVAEFSRDFPAGSRQEHFCTLSPDDSHFRQPPEHLHDGRFADTQTLSQKRYMGVSVLGPRVGNALHVILLRRREIPLITRKNHGRGC